MFLRWHAYMQDEKVRQGAAGRLKSPSINGADLVQRQAAPFRTE
jgi:hypothetical protein